MGNIQVRHLKVSLLSVLWLYEKLFMNFASWDDIMKSVFAMEKQ